MFPLSTVLDYLRLLVHLELVHIQAYFSTAKINLSSVLMHSIIFEKEGHELFYPFDIF